MVSKIGAGKGKRQRDVRDDVTPGIWWDSFCSCGLEYWG